MKLCPLFVAILALTSSVAYADLSLKFTTRIEPGKASSPEMAKIMAEALAKESRNAIPDQIVRIKGNRALDVMGKATVISDFDGALLTIIDPEGKRYSMVTPAEYLRATKAMLAKYTSVSSKGPSSTLPAMKIDVTSRRTGQVSKVLGIETDETEVLVAMTMPGLPGRSGMRMSISLSSPTQAERFSNPKIAELQRHLDRAYVRQENITGILDAFPGAPAGLDKMVEAITRVGLVVRTRVGTSVGDQAFGMEMIHELTEFSDAGIPDSIFAIPRDYAPAPIADVLPILLPVDAPADKGDVKAPVIRPGTPGEH